MLYILNGFVTETAVGGKLIKREVRYLAPLKHMTLHGDYISFGGIPVEPTSLIRMEDEAAGDAGFVDFITRVSEATRSLAATIIAGNGDTGILENFQGETDVLVKRYKLDLATRGQADVDALRNRLRGIIAAYQ